MQITLFSFVLALFWGSLWIIAIYVLRRTRWKQSLGAFAIAPYVFCAARLLLPLEFRQTIIIGDDAIYAFIYRNLFLQKRDVLADQPLSVALAVVWLAGFCIFFVHYIRQYRKAIRIIERYAEPWDEHAQTILEQIQRQTGRAIPIQGYTLPHNCF